MQRIEAGVTMGGHVMVRWLIFALAFGAGGAVADDETPDPLQGFNRGVQTFNDTTDRWVLKPVAKGYKKVLPGFLRRSVTNFFDNLTYPIVIVNQLLQGKVKLGVADTGRFLMNTTVGMGGLLDPATQVGLAQHEEDFGQTFAKWGIGRGPYLVIPFLGPSTVRDGVGSLVNYTVNPTRYITDDPTARYSLAALYFIQVRAGLLDAEELISGDRYIFLRDAYLQRRDYLNKDGQVEDEFLDENWDE